MGIATGEGRISQVSDNLRDRIAAAMYADNAFGLSEYACAELADAVMRELHRDPSREPRSAEKLGLTGDGE
jgi:hypothetical protein